MGQESCAVEDREDGQTEIAPTSRGVAPPADPGKMWVSFSSFFSIFTSPLRQSARCFGYLFGCLFIRLFVITRNLIQYTTTADIRRTADVMHLVAP